MPKKLNLSPNKMVLTFERGALYQGLFCFVFVEVGTVLIVVHFCGQLAVDPILLALANASEFF